MVGVSGSKQPGEGLKVCRMCYLECFVFMSWLTVVFDLILSFAPESCLCNWPQLFSGFVQNFGIMKKTKTNCDWQLFQEYQNMKCC